MLPSLFRPLLLFVTLTLSACFEITFSHSLSPDEVYDVLITSHAPNSQGGSTTQISATVFLPDNYADGEPYPLVIHSHTWGGSRLSREDFFGLFPGNASNVDGDSLFYYLESEIARLRAAGYAVISHDLRGFGRGDDGDFGSADGSHALAPEFEIEDGKAILNWAVQNLNVQLDSAGDPRVALIGSSFGGAFSTMLALADTRVDAIVTSAGWFNLTQSLAPNGVLKKRWLAAVCEKIIDGDGAELSASVFRACNQTSFSFSRELTDAPAAASGFLRHGPAMYAALGREPNVDALILHSSRDTLFNLSEALSLFDYLQTGGQVNLLTHEAGHSLTTFYPHRDSESLGSAFCGQFDALQSIVTWLDWRMRDGPSPGLPPICLSLTNTEGVYLSHSPNAFPSWQVSVPLSLVRGDRHHTDFHATREALFVPLSESIASHSALAGSPIARLNVRPAPGNHDPSSASRNRAAVFVGIGLERNGQLQLIDNQITPVLDASDDQPQTIELAAIAEALQPGDRVGLLLFGRHHLFESPETLQRTASRNWEGNLASVFGTVDLPISQHRVTRR